jgi:hypothetical protein
MSFHSKQMRVLLRQNNFHVSIRTEISRDLHHRKPKMWYSCSIIKRKAMHSNTCAENTEKCNEPLFDKKHLLSKFSVMPELWYYEVEILKVTKCLICKRRSSELVVSVIVDHAD